MVFWCLMRYVRHMLELWITNKKEITNWTNSASSRKYCFIYSNILCIKLIVSKKILCIKLKCWNDLYCSATRPKIWFLRQGASPPALVKLFSRFRCMYIPVWWCFLVLFAFVISIKHVLLLWPSCPISWTRADELYSFKNKHFMYKLLSAKIYVWNHKFKLYCHRNMSENLWLSWQRSMVTLVLPCILLLWTVCVVLSVGLFLL